MEQFSDPVAVYKHALSLHQSGKLQEADDLYQRLLQQFPGNPFVLSGIGIIALQRGNLQEGIEKLTRSLEIENAQPMAHQNLGLALRSLDRLEEALACFDRAIAVDPDYADAYDFRGMVLQDLGRMEEALASHERAIALAPGNESAYNNRGVALLDLDRLSEALASFDEAIHLNPQLADAHCNRGNVLRMLGRLDESLTSCDQALALRPDYVRAHINRGTALQELMRLEEAQSSYDAALALEPDNGLAHWNVALLKLLSGDFEDGWRDYEWRWKKDRKTRARTYGQPLWLGDLPLAGKTLLIYHEQGLGDVIQFCRYVSRLNALGAQVILEVHHSLVALMSTLKGEVTTVATVGKRSAFNLQCPIMSLPFACRTTLDSIPATVPYLYSDTEKQRAWREKLGTGTKPRVGLVWSGSAAHANDRNRSIPLQLLEPLLRLPVEFHALQQEIRLDDAARLAYLPQLHLHQNELRDFSDTASLVSEMDLVISVDTSVAHLAGALGKPLWLLLPFFPDYRWMLDRTDTPWYPTATLYRQPAIGDWQSVIDNLVAQLRSRYGISG